MIPRLLVPFGARPPAGDDAATQRRRPTTMDERTLVQANLPIVPLNGQSTIPTNLPLESIAARVVVPRDISREAYGVREDVSTPLPLQPTDLDQRITVPVGAAPPTVIEPMTLPPPVDLVEPDVFMTGEVHLSAPEQREDKTKWQVTRFSSVAIHLLLLTLILLQSKLFPQREPTQSDIDLARRQLTLLLPPGAFEAPKPSTRPPAPTPQVHVDPRILHEVAPPIAPAPAPAPQPERPARELPSAPIPKTNAPPTDLPPSDPTPKADAPKPPLKLEPPDTPQPQHGLILPKTYSSGSSVEDTIRSSPRISAPRAIVGGGRVSGGARGGGGSGGTAYGGIELLTPDQGVDFTSYLQRVHDVIERNWFAVMPPSVELGDRGIVVLTFRINRDGSVPAGEPVIESHSGKEPLDRAAFSSVRASNPFERLPTQFNGPYIELRFAYLYNVPLEEYYRQR